MSFKSISNSIFKKVKFLDKKDFNETQLSGHLDSFLRNIYGDYVVSKISLTLEYIPDKGRLIIQTNSKSFANDLIIRLGPLTEFLSQKAPEISQIIIK